MSGHLTVKQTAAAVGVSPGWVREHLDQFPNVWRLPGGVRQTATGAQNLGELRIPAADVEALARRQRIGGAK